MSNDPPGSTCPLSSQQAIFYISRPGHQPHSHQETPGVWNSHEPVTKTPLTRQLWAAIGSFDTMRPRRQSWSNHGVSPSHSLSPTGYLLMRQKTNFLFSISPVKWLRSWGHSVTLARQPDPQYHSHNIPGHHLGQYFLTSCPVATSPVLIEV